MQKKLHLMSELTLRSYCNASKELKEMAIGMSAQDVKENSEYIITTASVNKIPSDGNLKLEIDSEGTAHIPITGMLTNKVTPSAAFEGQRITTYNFITESTNQANENQKVKNIVYEINTGGGEVDGIEPASNAIFGATKPTKARVHFAAESGGLWLASQADKIVSVGKTPSFGSLGVAAEFVDRTEENEKAGRKTIILTSEGAPNKRFDIKTAKGQQIVIDRMNEVHQVFVEHIVRGRKKSIPSITADFVNKNFAKGGSLGAERALEAGMIDEIEGVMTQTTNAGGAMVASTDQSPSGQQPGQAPAIQTEGKMDEKKFLAFLESNPDAKAFYENKLTAIDSDITTMRAEVEKMKTDHVSAITEASTQIEANQISEADAKFNATILSSDAYGASVKNICIDALIGKSDMKTVKMMVALADEQNEKIKGLQIVKNQPGATPSQDHDLENGQGAIETSAKAMKEQLNNQAGVQ